MPGDKIALHGPVSDLGEGVCWTRYEGTACNGSHVILGYREKYADPDWVLIIDGVVRGRFKGPDAVVNAHEAIARYVADIPKGEA